MGDSEENIDNYIKGVKEFTENNLNDFLPTVKVTLGWKHKIHATKLNLYQKVWGIRQVLKTYKIIKWNAEGSIYKYMKWPHNLFS